VQGRLSADQQSADSNSGFAAVALVARHDLAAGDEVSLSYFQVRYFDMYRYRSIYLYIYPSIYISV